MSDATGTSDARLLGLLTLVRSLPTRVRTVRVETQEWEDMERSSRARDRARGLLARDAPTRFAREPRVLRRRWVAWMDLAPGAWNNPVFDVLPGRWREEVEVEAGSEGEGNRIVLARDGDTFWCSDRSGGVRASRNDRSRSAPMSRWIVGTGWTAEPAQLAVFGRSSMLGRAGLEVRWFPPEGRARPFGFLDGDWRDLVVDSVTGTTLGVTSVFDREPFRRSEVVALELDAEFPSELTAIPDGAAVMEALARTRVTSPRDIAAAARLTVLSPTWLPPGFVFRTGSPRADDGSDRPCASLFFLRNGREVVTIREMPDSEPVGGVYEWERVDRAGRTVLITDISDATGTRLAQTTLVGTRACVTATLSTAELLDLMFSLDVVAREDDV